MSFLKKQEININCDNQVKLLNFKKIQEKRLIDIQMINEWFEKIYTKISAIKKDNDYENETKGIN